MKILLFLTIIFTISCCMYATTYLSCSPIHRLIDKIGQSKFIVLYSKYIQRTIDRCMSYGDQPASQKYQDLGREAQNALAIPPHLQLPVKKIKGESVIGAIVGSDGIYVNEERLDARSFGAMRFTLFHEAVHVKYHDAAMLGLCKIIGFCIGSIAMYKILNFCDITTLHTTLSILIGCILSFGLSFKYRQYMERRADDLGSKATGCKLCIQEDIEHRTNMFESAFSNMPEEQKQRMEEYLKKNYADKDPTEMFENFECLQGYLTRTELEQIKETLNDQPCLHHLS